MLEGKEEILGELGHNISRTFVCSSVDVLRFEISNTSCTFDQRMAEVKQSHSLGDFRVELVCFAAVGRKCFITFRNKEKTQKTIVSLYTYRRNGKRKEITIKDGQTYIMM